MIKRAGAFLDPASGAGLATPPGHTQQDLDRRRPTMPWPMRC